MMVGLYFCNCGATRVTKLATQKESCLVCGSELTLETRPTLQMLSMSNSQLELLWSLFARVKYNPEDEGIEESFLCWLPTTNRFGIWLWFADQYKGNFIDLPGKLIWQEHGRRQPHECSCGQHIEAGEACYLNIKHEKVLCDSCGKREMTDLWLFEGYRNPWIRTANDPFFDRSSFCFVDSLDELLEKFRFANWCMGNAYVYKNLAFINQVEGGGEWLTIKDWCPFESITFKAVLRHGDEYTKRYIRQLLKYDIENRQLPDYSVVEALV